MSMVTSTKTPVHGVEALVVLNVRKPEVSRSLITTASMSMLLREAGEGLLPGPPFAVSCTSSMALMPSKSTR